MMLLFWFPAIATAYSCLLFVVPPLVLFMGRAFAPLGEATVIMVEGRQVCAWKASER
jgi:hypothetical protein